MNLPNLFVIDDGRDPDFYLAGSVVINKKEMKGIEIRVTTLKKTTVTDEFGSFKIEYPKKGTQKKRLFFE